LEEALDLSFDRLLMMMMMMTMPIHPECLFVIFFNFVQRAFRQCSKTFELAFPFTSVFKVSFHRHAVGVIVILFAIIALEHFKLFYSPKLFF